MIRWHEAPPRYGCRWCGRPQRWHAVRQDPWRHRYTVPTDAQTRARTRAQLNRNLQWLASGRTS